MTTMNGLIRQTYEARRGIPATTDRAAELRGAQEDLHRAQLLGDETAVQQADARIDAIVQAAREAQTPPEPPQTSFDAGAQRAVQQPPNMNAVIRNAYDRR